MKTCHASKQYFSLVNLKLFSNSTWIWHKFCHKWVVCFSTMLSLEIRITKYFNSMQTGKLKLHLNFFVTFHFLLTRQRSVQSLAACLPWMATISVLSSDDNNSKRRNLKKSATIDWEKPKTTFSFTKFRLTEAALAQKYRM